MADPFEVRMRFSTQLQHLSASITAAQKAANYALKNREMDEDLHSCILEQLERNNMNTRANIMYFIEHLCDLAIREGHMEFVRMVRRDVMKIVDAVAPEDGSGAANVKVVRRVLQALRAKDVLEPATVTELETVLKTRDVAPSHPSLSSTLNGTSGSRNVRNGAQRLDKRQIEQRIEEDRERHKRLRESIWAIGGEGEEELEKLWDEASDAGDDEYLAGGEDLAERRQGVEMGTV